MGIRAFAIGLTVAWAATGGARATTMVQFTIKGGDPTATFELPLSPTLDVTVAPFFFGILSVPAVVGGSPVTLPGLYFFSTELGETGGFFADGFFSFSGPKFYTGSESSPTFNTDFSMPLTNAATDEEDTVTVTELAGTNAPDPPGVLAVPELSTWAMLLLGFVGLSCAGCRKARKRTALPA
jgi:hypothetical protein